MKLATPEAFARDPERGARLLQHAPPQPAGRDAQRRPRRAGAARGRRGRGGVFLCTQNIDDLHERAGSRSVHHMHGELLEGPLRPVRRRVDWRGDLSVEPVCPACGRTGGMRPDVVWFGEMPFGLDRIEAALAAADLLRLDRHLGHGLSGRRLRRRGPARAASRPSSSTSSPPTTPAPSTTPATARPPRPCRPSSTALLPRGERRLRDPQIGYRQRARVGRDDVDRGR